MNKLIKGFVIVFLIIPIAFFATGCRNDYIENPFKTAIQADLVSQYELTFTAYIWNDFQPSIPQPLRSTHFVGINTPQELDLSQIQMSVQIITANQNIVRLFTFRTYGGGSPQGDFRSTEIFRLCNDEKFTLHISILIGNYTQTVTLTGTVFVTH
ncbi:MAG: hypothetical protein FWE16_02940 [Firmicutes bacterium]|nr:hypothetical protein [Bacillota bacterium]